jgi:ubiquinone/menaquinone biosynthesis C-methylase UbiE
MKESEAICRVRRSKQEAGSYYDRLSRFYDWLGGLFERRPALRALDCLQIKSGESVLEIGFGTGHCLLRTAGSVGDQGIVCGIDISAGMVRKSRKRLETAALLNRVTLCRGDAAGLPFGNQAFDVAFISFTLELFDSPEIPEVLSEVKRVLKPGGRLGIVSLSKTRGPSLAVSIYERVHNRWPKYVDCRPIYAAGAIQKAGFRILLKNTLRLVVLPVELVIAIKEV